MHPRLLTPGAAAPPALLLPYVTLVAVTSIAVPQTVRALTLSLAQAQFGAALLLSDQPPLAGSPDAIRWEPIAPLRSRDAYSRFILRDLRRYVHTQHVLCVQWDGYVLDGRNWDPAFLDYDYIGAPWPHFGKEHTVGNGGFSLRSARLLDACIALGIAETPEDVAICRTHRAALERDFGIRFAPEPLARHFAFERHARRGDEFGFHGAFNLADLLTAEELSALITPLEAGVLNRREHRELLRFALRHGHFALARTIWRRMRHAQARRH